MRQPRFPIGRDQVMIGDRLDIIGQRQRHDIRPQPLDNRPGLFARTAVRLGNLDCPARKSAVIFDEPGVISRVQFARGIIRHVEQLNIRAARGAHPDRHAQKNNP